MFPLDHTPLSSVLQIHGIQVELDRRAEGGGCGVAGTVGSSVLCVPVGVRAVRGEPRVLHVDAEGRREEERKEEEYTWRPGPVCSGLPIFDIDVVFSIGLFHGLSHSQHSLSVYTKRSLSLSLFLSKVPLAQFALFVDRHQHLGALGDHRHHRRRHALPRQQPHRAARGARGERVGDAGAAVGWCL